MHRLTRTAPPEWQPPATPHFARAAVVARPVLRSQPAIAVSEFEADAAYRLDPYLDYGRFLTEEGGILLVYKDLDTRLRHTLWQLLAWLSVTGLESWLALRHLDAAHPWGTIAALAVAGILNAIIVSKPVELYRHVEIRPDCLIIEGQDVFWQRHMDGGPPTFRPDAEGNQVLCGIYGTRFVEYLTIRRFDDEDRMPEIFALHLADAMEQLWTAPIV